MRKIILIVKPVAPNHTVYVLEDGNILEEAKVPFEKIESIVQAYVTKYDVKNISIAGTQKYAMGIANRIHNATNYDNKELNIDFVGGF